MTGQIEDRMAVGVKLKEDLTYPTTSFVAQRFRTVECHWRSAPDTEDRKVGLRGKKNGSGKFYYLETAAWVNSATLSLTVVLDVFGLPHSNLFLWLL